MHGELNYAVNVIQRQHDRQRLRIKTVFDPEPFAIKNFRGFDAVSVPFSYVVDLVAIDACSKPGKMMGQPLGIVLATPRGDRYFHGYVEEITDIGDVADSMIYRVGIAPWFTLLQYGSKRRIFQDKSIIEIIEEVFSKYPTIADYRFDIESDNFAKLPCCVQYDESDFDFVSRLLESASIYYAFEHRSDGHSMVLSNDSSLAKPSGKTSIVHYRRDKRLHKEGDLVRWTTRRRISADIRALREFDYKASSGQYSSGRRAGRTPGFTRTQESDAHGGGIRFLEREYSLPIGENRRGAVLWPAKQYEGSGTVSNIYAGNCFVLADHPAHTESEFEAREFFVTEVHHEVDNDFVETERSDRLGEYRCRFTCFNRKDRYRPLRKSSSQWMPGPQMATIVELSNEAFDASRHGWIKVQFHWEDSDPLNDRRVCWARIARSWTSQVMSDVPPLRIGQKVIVNFLEDDPICPVVVHSMFETEALPDAGKACNARLDAIEIEGALDAHIPVPDEEKRHDPSTFMRRRPYPADGSHGTVERRRDTVDFKHVMTAGTGGCCMSQGDRDTRNGKSVIGEAVELFEADHVRSVIGRYQMAAIGGMRLALSGGYEGHRDGIWSKSITGPVQWQAGGHVTEILCAGRTTRIHGDEVHDVDGNVEDSNRGSREVIVDGEWVQVVSGTCQAVSNDRMTLQSGESVVARVGHTALIVGDGLITLSAGGSEIMIDANGVSVNGAKIKLN